jgi:signal transduction histidine kinase
MKTALPARYETTLYKVLQGALSNVAAHAEAEHVNISLSDRKDSVCLKVEDDGKGFDVGRKLIAPPQSYGLRAMRDRIELLGGTIQYTSHPARRGNHHHGTSIEVRLPLQDSTTP